MPVSFGVLTFAAAVWKPPTHNLTCSGKFPCGNSGTYRVKGENGFVTTNMTDRQLAALIEKESGVTIAKGNGGKIRCHA